MPEKLSEQIKNKPAKERAKLKGIEIAKKLKPKKTKAKAKNNKHGYDFEITDIKAIEKGVEVYARVFEKGKQIGFGKDGSVDIERFIFINPPVLVDDENGDIIREWTDEETKEVKQRKLKEDPQEAILQALEHTISVKKQKFGDENIVEGKIGNTTSTFYPDANPESTSVDGYIKTIKGLSWSQAHDDTSGLDNYSDDNIFYVFSVRQTKWKIGRGVILFDTSALPDDDNIDSATVSLYGDSTLVQDDDDQAYIGIVSSNPASNTSLTNGDVDSFGTTLFADTIDIDTVSTDAYNVFAVNATGKSNISKTSITKFGVREGHDIEDIPITDSIQTNNQVTFYAADEAGTDKDPKLVVEHSVSFIPKILMS